jgi:hypothetical protein
MTTLVIHPFDPTTAFLGHIYYDKDWTVYNQPIGKKHLKAAIKQHDRIIMLGHGTDMGMFGFGRFIIDSTWVYLLRKKQVVAIWCNADLFVKRYDLNGFYTGMIISDNDEAAFFLHTPKYTMEQISDSNKLFAEAMRDAIDSPAMLETATKKYVGDDNPIIEFNRHNIYQRGTTKEN